MSGTNGIGYFTGENLAAVLRALPETDGTYDEVIERARDYGAEVTRHTLSKWLTSGRKDGKMGKRTTAFARFAQHYDELREKNCNGDANRNREYERALAIMERTCECGEEKMVLPDGNLAEMCRKCDEIESTGQARPTSPRNRRNPRNR